MKHTVDATRSNSKYSANMPNFERISYSVSQCVLRAPLVILKISLSGPRVSYSYIMQFVEQKNTSSGPSTGNFWESLIAYLRNNLLNAQIEQQTDFSFFAKLNKCQGL